MKKAGLIAVVLLLASAGVAGLWWWTSNHSTARQDSADTILSHIRSSQSSLTLVNFWASWCEPCKEELPALWQLKGLYPDTLKVVLISIDDPADVDTAAAYLRDNKMEFTTFYKGTQPLKFVTDIYPQWSGVVPASILMSSEAKVLEAWEGATTFEELKQRVQKRLRGS